MLITALAGGRAQEQGYSRTAPTPQHSGPCKKLPVGSESWSPNTWIPHPEPWHHMQPGPSSHVVSPALEDEMMASLSSMTAVMSCGWQIDSQKRVLKL